MIVEDARIRIVREKSTLYELPNVINQSVYDKDDIAESRPQRFVVVNREKIEWIRMEVTPTQENKIVFLKTK